MGTLKEYAWYEKFIYNQICIKTIYLYVYDVIH